MIIQIAIGMKTFLMILIFILTYYLFCIFLRRLNILNNLVLRSNNYFMKMKTRSNWNLEQLIKFHLEQNNVLHLVKEFPYVMYAVRNINGSTRWSQGNFSDKLGYYIKYQSEYDKSSYYKDEFEKSGLTIDEFYKNIFI